MNLTNRQFGIALYAIAATMKAFDVSPVEALDERHTAFRRGQILKHKDINTEELVQALMDVDLRGAADEYWR